MSAPIPPLPVGGWDVALRPMDGADELLVQEADGPPAAVALALLSRLAHRPSGEPFDVASLVVTDFEVLLLRLRARIVGPRIDCVLRCPNPGCGERLEIPFEVHEYLRDVRPRRPRDVSSSPVGAEWLRIEGASFRLPTVGDQVAVQGWPDATDRLVRLCIAPPQASGRLRSRVERAMALLAPEVSRPLHGQCPECAQPLQAFFSVADFVVAELRRASAEIYDDVHCIASAYRWTESAILALPRRRRLEYADRARALLREVA